jgi:hypothetical protein
MSADTPPPPPPPPSHAHSGDKKKAWSAKPEENEFLLQTPYTMLISGAHSSGKTTFVKRLLEKANEMYVGGKSDRVFFFYKQWQPMFNGMSDDGVEFIEGLPTADWAKKVLGGGGKNGPTATVVIDDQGTDLNADIANMFTVTAHHSATCFIAITHTLFGKTPSHRLISMNSTYIVVAKNPRDGSAIGYLGRQVDVGRASRFVAIFKEATREPYTYLFIDNTQSADDRFRLRSNVLLENGEPMRVYERA